MYLRTILPSILNTLIIVIVVSNKSQMGLYQFLPESFCKKQLLNLEIGEYIILIGLAILIWLTNKFMSYCMNIIYKLPRKVHNNSNKQSTPIARFVTLFISICFLKQGLQMLQPEPLNHFSRRIIHASTTLFTVFFVYTCINIIQNKIKIIKKNHKFIIHILPLLTITAKIIVGIVGLVNILDNLGFSTKSLVQTLSFSTLGIGLAFQDTVKNLFGSLLIAMDRPFSVGDEIIFGVIRGKVEEVGFRSTLLRTKEGSLVYIPNSKLADSYIDNFCKRTSRKVSLEIPLSYNISLDLLPRFIKGLKEISNNETLVKRENTTLYIDKMDENGFAIIFNLHLDTTDNQIENEFKSRIIPLILQLASQLGIHIGKLQQINHIGIELKKEK